MMIEVKLFPHRPPISYTYYQFIELIGKTSTRRMPNQDKENSIKWVNKYVVEKGHLGLLEHMFVSFHIYAPRFVIDQLTRHRHISWVVESTQRVDYEEAEFEAAYPDQSMAHVNYEFYKSYKAKTNRREARRILPLGLYACAFGSCNLRALAELIAKRAIKQASPETRQVAQELYKQLKAHFDAINWEALIKRLAWDEKDLELPNE